MSGDHKFVNERLLEIAIPPEPDDGKPITLEDCLELYFNNRVEVKRYLERQNTMRTIGSSDSMAKGLSTHIETVDLGTAPPRLTPSPQLTESPSETPEITASSTNATPSPTQTNTTSIIQERIVPETSDHDESNLQRPSPRLNRGRKGSIRKEVMMPAWQIFSLLRE